MTRSEDALATTLAHLRVLVSHDTVNPPRDFDAQSPLFAYLEARLEACGFTIEVTDLGDGCVCFMAVRGNPTVLLNCHLDTVPANASWDRDPFDLLVTDEVAVGLGACDIKGAAACMLTAASQTDGPIAILFTTDEEAGSSRCVKDFLSKNKARYDLVVVAEPTGCEAVLEHRGILTQTGNFKGVPGHASQARALTDSAVHDAVRWGASAHALATEYQSSETYKNLSGVCFNLGRIEGGVKPNMIAAEASVRWGIRPLPSHDPKTIALTFSTLAPRSCRVNWTPGFYGPTLPAPQADGSPGSSRVAKTLALVEARGLTARAPVDFWTEAALFSQAGLDAVVLGPGDIAQAHAEGEWVHLSQLERAVALYGELMTSK